jgi:hypothetical protein
MSGPSPERTGAHSMRRFIVGLLLGLSLVVVVFALAA